MMARQARVAARGLVLLCGGALLAGCESYPFLTGPERVAGTVSPIGNLFPSGQPFIEELIQERTFVDGTAATTVTYRTGDLTRTPMGIDFNNDGKIDPVIAYGETQALIQILLSRGAGNEVEFLSLTLDSKRDMENLADVAVGDIDGDGYLDIVASAEASLWYFHHPTGLPTTELRQWGNPDPLDTLREQIDASLDDPNDPAQNTEAIIAQAVGPGVNLDDYIITVEQLYTQCEIADFDNDSDNDIAVSRRFNVLLTPRPDVPVQPIQIVDGDVIIFENPGFATTGRGWTRISIGRHERQQRLDRDGAAGLLVSDIDGDGDFDLLSAASDDNNVQVVWYENPGGRLRPDTPWTPWRVGSVRDATGVDIADLTGDGRPDVVATGGTQMQMLLFEQPASGPKRSYDWDTHTIVTFENFQPIDVKALDIDNDGQLELVAGGSEGAVRYFESPPNPRTTWSGVIVHTFELGGVVGLLGYGDLDGDADLDLVSIVKGDDENQSRLVWIRNELN